MAATLVTAPLRGGEEIEPFRHLVTPANERALAWVRAHARACALRRQYGFLVAGDAPRHGCRVLAALFGGVPGDGRGMLLNLSARDEIEAVVADSQAVVAVARDPTAVDLLRARGLTHLYIGARGNFDGSRLDPDILVRAEQTQLLYNADGVWIFALRPTAPQ